MGWRTPYRYVDSLDSRGWREPARGFDAAAEFALRLVESAVMQEAGSVTLSPALVQAVLGMVEAGAGRTTRREIRSTPCGAKPGALPRETLDAGTLKEPSSLWVNGKTPRMLRKRYVDEVQRRFGADIVCMPFDERMVQMLNNRVAIDAYGMIEKMLGGRRTASWSYLTAWPSRATGRIPSSRTESMAGPSTRAQTSPRSASC